VAGSQAWHCQSSAGSPAQQLAADFTTGPLLKAFKPGEFKFEGADPLRDAHERLGGRLVKALGVTLAANADPALQERLVAAGLLEELVALRFGAHPYLPKARFVPGGRELAEQLFGNSPAFAGLQPALEKRLRAAEGNAGSLVLDVEAGADGVPSAERFQELLEHAVAISGINAEVNQPS
jgi:hypothetical protein